MFRKILLVSVLFLSSCLFSNISYAAEGNLVSTTLDLEVNFGNDSHYEILEDTDVFQKIKFTNVQTGEVEYLEATINGDDIVYRAFYDNMEAVIADNSLTLHNLSTGEVEIRDITPIDGNAGVMQSISLDGNADIGTQSVPVDGTHYELYNTYKSSKSLDVGTEAFIVGVLAAICGVPITHAILLTTASYYYGIKAANIWYIQDLYLWRNSFHYQASNYKFYRYPDYTNFINSVWKQNW